MTMSNTEGAFGDDFFSKGILGQHPRAAFFSFQNQFGRSQNQRKFYQGQFANVQSEFEGQLAQQLRQGVLPQQSFTDFLEGFPFTERFAAMAPSTRGAQTSRFAPQARFDFFQ
jgi:hypothetical protein